MNYDIYNESKECFLIATQAGWQLKNINEIARNSSWYKFGISELTNDEIIMKAFLYAKKTEYLDVLLKKIIRKNEKGKDLAKRAFQSVFPDMYDIEDLYNRCFLAVYGNNVKDLSKEIGITVPLINYYAGESSLGKAEKRKKLKEKEKEFREKLPAYCKVIDFLVMNDDEESIIKFFQKVKGKINFKKMYDIACFLYPDMDYAELGDNLQEKIRIYKSYLTFENSKERAFEFIKKYINSEDSLEEFYKQEKLTQNLFYKFVLIVQKYNNELYEKYKKKYLDEKRNERMHLINVIKYINNGIDGRKFTILDYLRITDLSTEAFFMIVRKDILANEYDEVRNFVNRYRNLQVVTMEELLKEKTEINCQCDKEGNPIANTGHMVTNEEKKEIIKRIEKDGFPLYVPVYNYYLNDFFKEKNVKVKKKAL